MQIELNDDEARVLKELLNVAVKAAGLDAAEATLHFARKIDAAKQEAATPATASEQPQADGEG